jgi:hypothetical protein
MSHPRILPGYIAHPGTCRCGKRIPVDWVAFRVTSLPDAQQVLFRDQVFCSRGCLRAFCWEILKTLEELDTPVSKTVVTDLREFRRELAQALAAIQDPPV